MSQHPSDELLESFALGELGEHLAAHTARHIDACPRCANRVTSADPMARLFASVDDPPVPDVLLAALRDAAARPQVASSDGAEAPAARGPAQAEAALATGVGLALLVVAWVGLWVDPAIADVSGALRLARAAWATLRALGPSSDEVVVLAAWAGVTVGMLLAARALTGREAQMARGAG